MTLYLILASAAHLAVNRLQKIVHAKCLNFYVHFWRIQPNALDRECLKTDAD
jgi:hypothetical protein